MLKPKTYDVADSNLALFGSDIEKNVKKAAAETEPAWKNAGKEVGIAVWRIEKFKVVSWPKDQYGKFFSGDSYIVLNSYKDAGSNKMKYNVHFWLGSHTSQDEAGTAAYKTVELDTLLGDVPVQYREVQGHESEQFLGCFPSGVQTMEGGVETGFKHVKPEEYQPRLFQLKGKKNIKAQQVSVSCDSLNEGDSFILDAGTRIFVWNGKEAGAFEKQKAGQMAQQIASERGGKATVSVHESSAGDLEPFWKLLGGKKAVKSAAQGGSDADADKGKFINKMFRVSDASGKMEFKEVGSGKLAKTGLDTKDVFMVDTGSQVFVWIGKGASANEKAQGLQIAADYLKKTGRPAYTSIVRVLEGGENENFNAAFN